MKRLIQLSFILVITCAFGQDFTDEKYRVDVKNYDIRVHLSDISDTIDVSEKIIINRLEAQDTIVLDLTGKNKDGVGMTVKTLKFNDLTCTFTHDNNLLMLTGLPLLKFGIPNEEILIEFIGKPADGLVIGKNKFEDRTFFGDNWPNRAHNWFACNDYLSDKANVRFVINAPEHYNVISNGTNTSTTAKSDGFREWTYLTNYDLPTKVMVIGVADFNISQLGQAGNSSVPISAWVYPQDATKGIYDMALAPEILAWFEKKIAPYPFDKLANVQSTTRYGGMENASCIFYDEKAIDGKRSMEMLIAHEIAHQWFGNSATEKDFSHLWLSEGFATYMTNVYILETKGKDAFYNQMDKDRAKVITFNKRIPLPVIDTLTSDLNQLLNANAYQKGSWILHMLRMKLGDDVFWNGIRSYYQQFAYNNADSKDFEAIMENTCSCDLTVFFNQWLRIGGNPKLKISVKSKRNIATINIQQETLELFNIPLEIEFISKDGSLTKEIVTIKDHVTKIKVKLPAKMKSFKADPERKLLVELS